MKSPRGVAGMSRCLLCTVSTGAGSPDPRGAHRVLAMMVASMDFTPAPNIGLDEKAPHTGPSEAFFVAHNSVPKSTILFS